MEVLVSYQQDTVQVVGLQQTGDTSKANVLNVERSTIRLQELTEQRSDSLNKIAEQKPTQQQIRYWRWQREKKLTIDSSRYIIPKTDAQLTNPMLIEKSDPELPVRENNFVGTDWLTVLMLFVLVIFATVRTGYSKYMGHLFLSLINYSTSYRMFQESNYPAFHGAFRLEAIFYFTFSMFVFFALNYLEWELANKTILYFALIFGMVLFYFFGKKFAYKVLGSIFEGQSETAEFIFNLNNFNRAMGLVLFPVVALISLYPSGNPVFIVFLGIAVILTFYFWLLIRGILILLKKHFSIFYLFLYLCTLEFLPLLLIYKVVVD